MNTEMTIKKLIVSHLFHTRLYPARVMSVTAERE